MLLLLIKQLILIKQFLLKGIGEYRIHLLVSLQKTVGWQASVSIIVLWKGEVRNLWMCHVSQVSYLGFMGWEGLHGIFGARMPPVLCMCSVPGRPVSETCRRASWEHNRESGHQLREWCARRDGFPKPYRGEHGNTAGWCLKHFNTNVIFTHFLSSPVE